jgi:nucleoid DNA-binding protein
MAKEKISSQEIVEMLAEQAGITKKSADEFLKAMFSTIEETLLAGDSVKIKKFGTFKLQSNAARKSVNVQTGENIIIPGYYKVNFAPDAMLKDAVNEPFSHLDSVRLDEKDEPIEKSAEDGFDQMGAFTEQANEIKDILSEIQSLKEDDTELVEAKQDKQASPPSEIETYNLKEDN